MYMFVVPSSFVLTEEELDELVECINLIILLIVGYMVRDRRERGEQVDYVVSRCYCGLYNYR